MRSDHIASVLRIGIKTEMHYQHPSQILTFDHLNLPKNATSSGLSIIPVSDFLINNHSHPTNRELSPDVSLTAPYAIIAGKRVAMC